MRSLTPTPVPSGKGFRVSCVYTMLLFVGPVISCVLFFRLDILSIFFEIRHPMFFVFFNFYSRSDKVYRVPLVCVISLIGGRGVFLFCFLDMKSIFFWDRTSQIVFIFTFCEIGQCFMRFPNVPSEYRLFTCQFPPHLRSDNESC